MANEAPAWTIDEAAATADTEPGSRLIASAVLPGSRDESVTTDVDGIVALLTESALHGISACSSAVRRSPG